jgi:hypothetical protein
VAAPTLHAAGSLNSANGGTTIIGVLPGGTLANDVAVLECMANVGATFTVTAGWDPVPGSTAINSANQSTAWFWKRLAGGDTNPTATSSVAGSSSNGLYARVYVFRGCVTTGSPFESVSNAGTPTNSTTPQSSAITTTDVDRLAVSFLLVDNDNVWSSGMPPASWANMGGRLASTIGGDCMSDAISRTVPTATTIAAATIGTKDLTDYWRSLSFAFIPESGAPVFGTATGNYIFLGSAVGTIGTVGGAAPSRAPIPAVLMVTTPGDWNTHPYYKTPVTALNWGRQSDLDLIDTALAAYPDRTRVVLIAEDSDTSLGNGVAAMNWALRHYDQVHAIALRTPIIDLEERHDRPADAASIDAAYAGGVAGLSLPGSTGNYASTPDAASLDITGDLEIVFDATAADWTPAAIDSLVSKNVSTGNQRSFRFELNTNGRPAFGWSPDGVTLTLRPATAAPVIADGARLALKVTLDADNGASGHDIKFYTAPTKAGSWTQLGTTVTIAGVASIFNSTAVLEIGSSTLGATQPFAGTVHAVEVRNGIGGTLVANPNFEIQTPGSTSFADTATPAKTWTVHGTAEIVSGSGAQISLWNPATAHRQDIAAQLLGDRMHIWRDPSDTVTPTAVTDAIATRTRATLHTSLGTTDDVVPDGQDWVNQPAWVEMKKLHDYARTNAATAGTWKSGDGGRTVILPDGRWLTSFADSHTGLLDADDTYGTGTIVRNAALIHNAAGTITGQHYSAGVGTVAFEPDQVDFPDSFYWPVGGAMDAGNFQMLMLHREGPVFGTAIDSVVLTLDPNDLSFISRTSLGEPLLEPQNTIPDPASGYIYITSALPIRIARVPIGQLTNVNAWEYWQDTVWQPIRINATELLELVDGQTRPLKIHELNNGWDIRRYGTGWLAVVRGWFEPYVGIYYATQPQGPWTRYRFLPTPEMGGNRWGHPIYAYTPFWHPERDPAPDRLMISSNATTVTSDTATVDKDFLYHSPHLVVCPIYRELFP